MTVQELIKAPPRNIINSRKWTDDEWLSYFQQRLNDMRSKKTNFDVLFTQYELQETAISYYDNQ
jgi:hypothetical protein